MNESEKAALRREGFQRGAAWQCEQPEPGRWYPSAYYAALKAFPDRTLRRVPDPANELQFFWTFEDGRPVLHYSCRPDEAVSPLFSITPARWAIWKDLEANPWEDS